jgi:hypothetical protein
MKRAVVYLRKGQFFARTVSLTEHELWVETGPCTKLLETVEPDVLGGSVLDHLRASGTIPHPKDWKLVQAPLLTAAGVKSWNTFGMIARAAGVKLTDEGIILEPRKNNKPGFQRIADAIMRLEGKPDARALGEAVKAAIAAST